MSVILGSVPETVTMVADGRESGSCGSSTGLGAPGILDQMVVSYAGFEAHVRYAPTAEERARRGAAADFAKARWCASRMGPGGELGGLELEALEKAQRARAAELVGKHWAAIERVARRLLVAKTIESDELVVLVHGGE